MSKKLQSIKWLKPRIFIFLVITTFIALIVFRNNLREFISGELQKNRCNNYSETEINDIANKYIYSNDYDYTFLEFGSKGCIACRKMEDVMDYVKGKFENVNVVFYNITTKEGMKYADYYGVVVIPTQVLLDSEGKEFYRHTGYVSENELELKFRR